MVAIKKSILLWASLATLTTAFPGQGQLLHRPGGVSNEVGPSNVMKAGGEQGGSGAADHHDHETQGQGADQGHEGQGHRGQGHGGQGQGNHARDEDGMSKHRGKEGFREKDIDHDEHRKGGNFGGPDNHPRDFHHYDPEEQGDHHAEGSDHEGYHKGQAFHHGNHPRAFHDDDHEHHEHGDDFADPRFPHIYARGTQLGVYECKNQNWILPCKWTPLTDGQCYNRIYDSFGSMGPDKGLTCTIYEQRDCNDKGWNTATGFHWPGLKNYQNARILANAGMQTGGVVSIRCKRNT